MKALPFLAALFIAGAALAHGQHQWVADGQYRSVADNTLCCGNNDCTHVAKEDVKLVGDEWQIRLGPAVVTIPRNEAQWSEDGKYSVCIWGGKVKCFFIPPVGV